MNRVIVTPLGRCNGGCKDLSHAVIWGFVVEIAREVGDWLVSAGD